MGFKKYEIKEGKHRSGIYFKPFLKKKYICYDVIFNKSCLYEFKDVDKYDINKLFGLSQGYHHKNSARFGWRTNGKKIELSAYCYLDGHRSMKPLISIDIDRIYILEIKNSKLSYTFKVMDDSGKEIDSILIPKNYTKGCGYELFPYFGGNKVAPHDIEIHMERSKYCPY